MLLLALLLLALPSVLTLRKFVESFTERTTTLGGHSIRVLRRFLPRAYYTPTCRAACSPR